MIFVYSFNKYLLSTSFILGTSRVLQPVRGTLGCEKLCSCTWMLLFPTLRDVFGFRLTYYHAFVFVCEGVWRRGHLVQTSPWENAQFWEQTSGEVPGPLISRLWIRWLYHILPTSHPIPAQDVWPGRAMFVSNCNLNHSRKHMGEYS